MILILDSLRSLSRRAVILTLFCTASFGNETSKTELQITVEATRFAPTNVLIVPLTDTPKINTISCVLQNDLQFSMMFKADIQRLKNIHTKKEMKSLFEQGYAFIIFINEVNINTVEVRLYDASEQEMVTGKKVVKQGNIALSMFAHKIADQLFTALTNKKSSFCSMIAACKKVKANSKKEYEHIYIFCPTQVEVKRLIVSSPTHNIAPRWHTQKPVLFFSQHTPTNVRLVSIDPTLTMRIITNFDGLNMTPAISQEGGIVISLTKNGHGVICRYIYDNDIKKGKFKAITSKNMHAISPSFINDEKIVFCLIKDRKPSIAILDVYTKNVEIITTGFCVAPTYSQERNSIAYCKKINGYSQIFTYNLKTKQHKQLTKDGTDKDECCWSPCGNYIVCSVDDAATSRLAYVQVNSAKIAYLTPATESWSFANWSPCYEDLMFL